MPGYENAEATELEMLKRRGYKPYSRGHQLMYLTGIQAIRDTGNSLEILDVGSGIGWGWEQMIRTMPETRYQGIDLDQPGVEYHQKRIEEAGRTETDHVYAGDFFDLGPHLRQADYSFCIEVLEHVPKKDMPVFLALLRNRTRKTVFLSTPDVRKNAHGRIDPYELEVMAMHAGFCGFAALAEQWTTLYILNARPF